MITTVSPLSTTLIQISPNGWTIFIRLKLFSKWELFMALDFKSSSSKSIQSGMIYVLKNT